MSKSAEDKVDIAVIRNDLIWIKDNLKQILEQVKITNGRVTKLEIQTVNLEEDSKSHVTKKDMKIATLSNSEKVKIAVISAITSIVVAGIGILVYN